MSYSSSQPIIGTAAGVPFTALPPPDDVAHAPLVVTLAPDGSAVH